MTTESWADAFLSQELLRLCESGEGENLEFKRQLPAQARDFAKEIAALASTAGGMILLGVDDDGTLVGVEGAQSASVRDELRARIVGISQTVAPPVRPELLWATAQGVAVLVVRVAKGAEPLYFVDGRAYIRHSTVSRPATPAEIQAAFAPPAPAAPTEHADSAPLSALASLLANILRWCDVDEQMRMLNPWLDEWTFDAQHSAGRLRELAATDWALSKNLGNRFEELAEKLDEVAGFRHTFGSAGDFEELCASARATAGNLMTELVEPVEVGQSSLDAVRSQIIAFSRQLDSLWTRAAKDIFDGRVGRAQEETSTIGARVAEWTYLPLKFLSAEARLSLRDVCLRMVSLATEREYFDGGDSQRRIVEHGRKLADEMLEITRAL